MSSKPHSRVSVIIPARNEADTIREVLARVKAVDLAPLGLDREIIVVDDGSEDGTAELVARSHPDVVLIQRRFSQGKGSAIRAAMQRATGDIILIQDGDLEYEPSDHLALLAPMVRQGARVVLGSRFLERRWPRGMTPAHWVANRVLTGLANGVCGVRCTDEATCYKVVEAGLLRSLELRCNGFDFCPELVAALGARGIPVVEVPVQYRARTRRQGKKIGWRDGLRAVQVLLFGR